MHDRIIEPFEGGYAAYILQRVERDRMAAVIEAKRQNLMKKELAWLRRGAPARTAKPKFRIDAANELIENEPPPRDTVSMQSMAMQRLGKDVVDLIDVTVTFPTTTGEDGAERHHLADRAGRAHRHPRRQRRRQVAPCSSLVAGTLQPTSGTVKRGKTIKVAVLTQQLDELDGIQNDRVSEVIGRQTTSYVAGGKEITPGQLLERMGFMSAQLSTQVKDLSGGQKRRLQLLLIVLDEPNVLILDEPTNDLDTDMLAAMEDLLDSFPGTLLVVSHDRYLIERVTDQQYAVTDGALPPPARRRRPVPRDAQEAGCRGCRQRRFRERRRRPTPGRRRAQAAAAQRRRPPRRSRPSAARSCATRRRNSRRSTARSPSGSSRSSSCTRSWPCTTRATTTVWARSRRSCRSWSATWSELETRWVEVSELLEG